MSAYDRYGKSLSEARSSHGFAAARSIPPEELRGATITLSNFGMIGGRFASLVVVPPQVAIIGAGRAERRVVVNNDQQVVHRMLPLSLTFDHRAVCCLEFRWRQESQGAASERA
jgi:pyruvate/2-oxoglutarate dehydrogenase complex dihydrolipoamide acyltransferase (E2) component